MFVLLRCKAYESNKVGGRTTKESGGETNSSREENEQFKKYKGQFKGSTARFIKLTNVLP